MGGTKSKYRYIEKQSKYRYIEKQPKQTTILKDEINRLQQLYLSQNMYIDQLVDYWKMIDERPGEKAGDFEHSQRTSILNREKDKLRLLKEQLSEITSKTSYDQTLNFALNNT